MLNKFMTRLYHTKTILYIIIIGLEAQPPHNIILLLHRHSGGDNDSNNNNNCCYCCSCCCYYYIIILAESLVPNYAFTGYHHLKMLQPLLQSKSGAIPVNN